jgi:hypothetical protein
MATYFARGGVNDNITTPDKREALAQTLKVIGKTPRKVLVLPPDHTRLNSGAGELTDLLYELLAGKVEVDIMPTLGTHTPMTEKQLRMMFGDRIPLDRFKVHDWRKGIRHVGDIPGQKIREWSGGLVDYDVRVEVSQRLFAGYDLILSVGQLVPHEVVGIANYTKNILTGAGGADTINKSHFLGAAYGMERMMGRIDTPVRRLFNYGAETFLRDLPIVYVLTVMEKNKTGDGMIMRGLYVGDDMETFTIGARLSQKVNLDLLDKPLQKVLVYLDPHEFKSTWLGNKSHLPHPHGHGRRRRVDHSGAGPQRVWRRPLRSTGSFASTATAARRPRLAAVKANAELQNNLSAAAHFIHGSSEGRFNITYCPGRDVSPDEIRSVGFEAGNLDAIVKRYQPESPEGRFQPPAGRRGDFLRQQSRARPLGVAHSVRGGRQVARPSRLRLSVVRRFVALILGLGGFRVGA